MLSKDLIRSFSEPLAPQASGSRRYRLFAERARSLVLVLALLGVSFGLLLQSKTLSFSQNSNRPSKSSEHFNSTDSRYSDASSQQHVNIVKETSRNVSEKSFIGVSDLFDLSSFDSGSLTAILPVTRKSVDRIQQIVEPLMSEQSHVSAITIVCPLELVSILDMVLHRGHMDVFLDISVFIWSEGLSEGAAVLGAASDLVTEYSLIMDSGGLSSLDEDSKDKLVSHPFLLDLPTGFCGGQLNEVSNHATCVLPHSEPQSASFLVPPFVIPSQLVRGFNSSTAQDSHFWRDFGKTFIHKDGVGAFIQETEKSAAKIWCQTQCQKTGLAIDGLNLEHCSTIIENTDAAENWVFDTALSSLAVILPALKDLDNFSPAVCGLIQRGYDVNVLILSYSLDQTILHDSSFPWLQDHLISSVCEISYSALHPSLNDYANAEAVRFWLQSANESMSVIVYGAPGISHARLSAFEVELERQGMLGATIIKIPQDDLRFCDWIGSLSLAELRSWHMPNIEIAVVTDDRPTSLTRLFKSLESARYFGDSVNIRISLEQTSDMETRRIVDDFRWDHGDISVHHRVVHGGLLTAIVESWYPRSNDSYGIILEDDVEVSPLFYAWTKMAILRYRYGLPQNKASSLFGISLYQQKQNELRPEGRRPFHAQSLFHAYGLFYHNTPYLSQIPCSWGAVYFPEHWREFHSYLMVRFSEAWLPMREQVVPHVRSNRWAKSWKRFFIELVYLRGYVMLYPNYDDFVSLSTNHLEIGSHVKDQPRSIYDQKRAMFTLPLMTLPDGGEGKLSTGLLVLPGEQMPAWSDLPVLDLLGALSSEKKLEKLGTDRQKEIIGCTTIGSQNYHHSFEAEDLFTCSANKSDDESKDFAGLDVNFNK
ncbi:hypothetical protein EW145_g1127 [Phellinidium pouzarii]|uniref:Uncharacterized protein n=1 Tax=Phellinidium pouzarii TaxID=167371 RepID=A0A4S4LL73_9AGAM|nr:hypothetical protein EW145_g1127 [Phellinidium pouzarii]